MKTTLPASFFRAGIILLALSTASQAENIPESVDINLQASNPPIGMTSQNSKTVPGFSHAKHATTILPGNSGHAGRPYDDQFTCTACHPGVKSADDILSQASKERQAEAVDGAGGVKKYMHGLCLDCHKSMKKAELATGPTSCKGCHNPQ